MAGQSESALALKRLRERSGLSVAALAAKIRRTKSTYAHYEDGYKKPLLPMELVEDLLPVLTAHGITEAEVLALAGSHFLSASAVDSEPPGQLMGRGVRLKYPTDDTDKRSGALPLPALPIVGDAEEGAWREEPSHKIEIGRTGTIPVVPDPRFRIHRQYALRVRDASMNKIIRPGAFAICVEVAQDWDWQHGDVVVVVRRRDGGMLRETTLKQVAITKASMELWPRSDDPRFQTPVTLGSPEEPSVEIVALVISAHVTLTQR